MTDNAGQWARDFINRANDEHQRREAKRAKIMEEQAKLDAEDRAAPDARLRAEAFDSAGHICPRCFIVNGASVEVRPIGSDGPGKDLMRCPGCGWEDTITV